MAVLYEEPMVFAIKKQTSPSRTLPTYANRLREGSLVVSPFP